MKGARSKADSANGSGRLAVSKAGRKTKKGKAAKDPNKPKRPPSAFFVFMEGFRAEFKEQNPGNKSVAALGKACGDKWRSMSDEDKAPFVAEAAKRKKDYEKNMDVYNRKLAGGNEDQESDKSKSEVNDDEEGSEEEEDDD